MHLVCFVYLVCSLLVWMLFTNYTLECLMHSSFPQASTRWKWRTKKDSLSHTHTHGTWHQYDPIHKHNAKPHRPWQTTTIAEEQTANNNNDNQNRNIGPINTKWTLLPTRWAVDCHCIWYSCVATEWTNLDPRLDVTDQSNGTNRASGLSRDLYAANVHTNVPPTWNAHSATHSDQRPDDKRSSSKSFVVHSQLCSLSFICSSSMFSS